MTPTDALPVRGNCRVILNMHNGLSKCIAHTSRFNIVEEDVTVDIQRERRESMVFVLDTNRKPLSPCRPAVARKLLKEGKRVVQGVNYKYFKIVQRFDGYSYRKEETNFA